MKKLLVISVLAAFALSVLAPSAFAFGNCAGKAQKTRTADTVKSDKGST